MFGFGKKNIECPVKDETRIWIEKCFSFLLHTFGRDKILSRKILTPDVKDFPIKYDSSKQSAIDTLNIVARQMEIDPNEINFEIYKEGLRELNSGELFGNRIFLNTDDKSTLSGGQYWGKQEDGKYHIGIEERKLTEPVEMVAALSHELSHIKLLGEGHLKKNNEELTDLTTIVFGLGIFNANVAFQTKASYSSWGYSKLGYLSQMEWGYALAYFSKLRAEDEPEWINFLGTNIKSDFMKSIKYMNNSLEGK